MNTLPYLFIASLYLLLFYGCYWLFLRRNTFFGLNRTYLLGSIILSVTLPALKLPTRWADTAPTTINTINLPAFVVGTNTTSSHELTTAQWGWLLYSIGVVVMLARLGLNLRAVYRLIRQGEHEPQPGYTLVQLPDDSSPSFSFGSYLVLNKVDSLTKPAALIRHEEAHIRQRHTLDVLFVEVARVAFWFNPVLWLYKRSLQEVHEFLADQAVCQTAQPDYAQQLVAYALNVSPTTLTTPFVSVSTLKQRIIMLQKPASNRRALLAYTLVLPLAALLTMCTQPDQPVTSIERPAAFNQPARQAGIDGEIFTVVEHQPEFPGGIKKLGNYLQENLRYPAAAQKANVQGRVFLSFIVTKEGDIADVKLLKGIGFGADEEAIRVLKAMPRWQPGRQNGKAVNVRYNVPINFTLEEEISEPVDVSQLTHPKHFIVDGNEISESKFIERSKSEENWNVIKADPASQTIYISTKANSSNALSEVKRFIINGKEATQKEAEALAPSKIAKVEVFKEAGESRVAVTTK
ncbi:TonB family protein [Spirosoma soli]|uniref:TonB family protein n=1 Tax=Spirosoma soli TaxID=1770529 RepID=A0ABW5M854_9BACT